MRFRSVWVQGLPLFAQVIAIFKKELETIDVFRSFFPVGNILEHQCDRRGIFSKPFRAQPRLIIFATFRSVIFRMERASRATWPVKPRGSGRTQRELLRYKSEFNNSVP
jgi:hypothetical protein